MFDIFIWNFNEIFIRICFEYVFYLKRKRAKKQLKLVFFVFIYFVTNRNEN